MMRPRTPTPRTQPPIRNVYEDFQPKSEMGENPKAHFMHIYVPGFTKDQVRITYVNSQKTMRITGERPLGGNRWSRFNQAYPIPENCEVGKLEAKFYQGTLTITMPKKLLSQVAEKIVPEAKPAEKAQEMLPQKSATAKVGEPTDKKNTASHSTRVNGSTADRQRPLFDIDQQKAAEEKGLRALIPPESTRESKPQKGKEETEQKPTLRLADERKQIDGRPQGQEQIEPKPTLVDPTRRVTGETPQRGPEEFDIKPKLKLSPPKQTEEKPHKGQEEFGVKLKLRPSPPKQRDGSVQKGAEETSQRTTFSTVAGKRTEERTSVGDAGKERVTRKKKVEESHGETSGSIKPEKAAGERKIKENERKEKYHEFPAKVGGSYSPPRISEREKETTGNQGKREEDMIDSVGKGIIKDVSAAASMAVTRITEGTLDDEEKNLLVNMGAAVMVIAALGVYVSYRFVSSGKS